VFIGPSDIIGPVVENITPEDPTHCSFCEHNVRACVDRVVAFTVAGLHIIAVVFGDALGRGWGRRGKRDGTRQRSCGRRLWREKQADWDPRNRWK